MRAPELRTWLQVRLAEIRGVDKREIDLRGSFHRQGLDSLAASRFIAELSTALGRPLSRTLLWEQPTIEALVRYLTEGEPATAERSPKPARAPSAPDERVAIIGMACRFPGAPNLGAFWEALCEGHDAIREVPADRWDADAYHADDPSAPGKMRTRWGGFLEHVDRFDPAFFGISHREASQMDPQQRLMLELAWEALEDAGLPPLACADSRSGVFVGAMWHDYDKIPADFARSISQHSATGLDLSIIPARISYTLGLRGPSVAINTACSSSLVALHYARRSVLSGECDVAIVGGVNLILSPASSIAMSKFGAMAPDGRSKAFDARANGYVRGEGGGVVILKRLSRALADGDPIRAIVLGSAVNNDGASNGLTAPSPRAQELVLREAYRDAGVEPRDVHFVETHGTGTLLGDPIEASALGVVLGKDRAPDAPLIIGSVKTNIGHLEAAAGIAGFIKAALALEKRSVPPNLHFQSPNPHIAFDALRLRVPTAREPWPAEARALAGVSSFGFGGTNCHVVLEGPPAPLEGQALPAQAAPGPGEVPEREGPVFIFGGQGSQWLGMGVGLLREPAFRASMARVSEAMRPYLEGDLLDTLASGDAAWLQDTAWIQPAIFAVQVSLAALLRARGVVPAAVVGQSMGEVGAAYVAGYLCLEDAARIICTRSRLVGRAAGAGGMAVVDLPLESAQAALTAYGDRLSVAVSTSPRSTVIAGGASDLDALLRDLAARGVEGRTIKVDYASHCAQMDPLLPDLARALEAIEPRRGVTPFYSTVTGTPISEGALDGAYWCRNLREPVLLAPTLCRLIEEGRQVFIELDPHPLTTRAVEDCARHVGSSVVAVCPMHRDEPAADALAAAMAALPSGKVSAAPPASSAASVLLPLSAHDASALRERATTFRAWLDEAQGIALEDIAYTAGARRSHLEHRLSIVGATKAEIAAALDAFVRGELPRGVATARAMVPVPRVVFVFSGQGSQWAGMGRQLYRDEPVFREALDRCDEALRAEAGFSVIEEMHKDAETSRLSETSVAQPALFALEVALSALLASWGVAPSAVIGHSVGEIAAAHVAGALDLAQAARLCALRARGMAEATSLGKMVSVALGADEARQVLVGLERRADIAAINDPTSVVLSGDAEVIDSIATSLVARGVRTHEIRVKYAFHSPQMDALVDTFVRALGTLQARPLRVPMISTVTGRPLDDGELDAAYWGQNIRRTVRFADAVAAASSEGPLLVVEVGPHPVLALSVEQTLAAQGAPGRVIPTLRREADERKSVLGALGALHGSGGEIAWERLFPDGGRVVALPEYPWQRERCWLEDPGNQPTREVSAAEASPDLLSLLDTTDEGALLSALGISEALSDAELAGARRALAAMRGRAQQAREASQVKGLFYRSAWRKAPRRAAANSERARGHWLVLCDEAGLGDAVGDALEAAGAVCTRLRLGPEGPPSPSEITARCSNAVAEKGAARGVVHLWGSGAPPGLSFEDRLRRGVYSALDWAQALVAAGGGAPPLLWLVTRGAVSVGPGDALVSPEQAPLWGLGRVIALEHREVWGGLVDLPSEASARHAITLVDSLLAGDGEDEVALRADGRHVHRLVRHESVKARPWNVRGTVLVTGGLGALGLRLARGLAARGASHLVLVSRRGMDASGASEAVASLEALGVGVTVARADVTDQAAMAALFADIDARLPPLSGVVHAAGSIHDGVLRQQDAARFAEVMAPKVLGARALDALTRGRRLDFFVLFSSSTSLLGLAGQSNYAAANAYLDALAHARRAAGLPAHVINWGPFRDGGMATEAAQRNFGRRGVRALSPDVLMAALGLLVQDEPVQVAVVDVTWPAFRAVQELGGPRPSLAEMPQPVEGASSEGKASLVAELAAAPVVERLPRLSRWVREAVAKTLGFADAERLDPRRGFFQQGMDSALAMELRVRLQQRLGLSLSTTVAFNYPTVTALSAFLLGELSIGEPRGAAPADVERFTQEPIAVIGMGCRLPGGIEAPGAFGEALAWGLDAVTAIPRDRWEMGLAVEGANGGAGRGAFLASPPDGFDPRFFGITPREAVLMDPQHRMLLEVTWEALEDAGVLTGDDAEIGIFVGIGASDYNDLVQAWALSEEQDPYALTGTGTSFSAGRLSYALGLRGPSMAVDTACSSSLVAIHLACQSLRTGESRVAVAGGVQLLLSPTIYRHLARLGALSADGRCKAFSAEADGFGRGEGCAMLVLKRVSDAQRDGDRILGLIRGSAINHDGQSGGLTVPNGLAQQAVLRQALANAGVLAQDVDYVEAHGTGTPLGDPIEVEAIGAVYGADGARKAPLWVGSVKTNIGHLEAAAGAAGLLKVLLSFERGALPAQLHARELNPHIRWAELPVEITTTARPWPRDARPRRAGVSSFGMSGTNAHVILEEPPIEVERAREAREAGAVLLPISAKSPEALTDLVRRYEAWLSGEAPVSLRDIAYTASVRRHHHEHRWAVVGRDRAELGRALSDYARGDLGSLVAGRASAGERPKVAFVFSGQGSQWVGMAAGLLRDEPVFRSAMQRCDALVQRFAGFSLLEALDTGEDTSRLADTFLAQPAIFAIQVALCEVWRAWGIEPDAVVGHSIGEVAAAFVAGALSLEDAARLVCARGQAMQKATGLGRMASVALSEGEARSLIKGYGERLGIAAINDAESVVLSGEPEALAEVVAELGARGVPCKTLRVDYAFHSPQMAPFVGEFAEALSSIEPRAPERPLYSTVTGAPVGGERLDVAYWKRNFRDPVEFRAAMAAAIDEGYRHFVEIGPHPVLTANAQENLRQSGKTGVVLPTLRRGDDERACLLRAFAGLYAQGYPVEWRRLYPSGGSVVSLPAYPWQRQRYWVERRSTPTRDGDGRAVAGRVYDSLDGLLGGGARERGEESWEVYLTFGPLREITHGFSWLDEQVMATVRERSRFSELILEAQREMRRVLFRHVDFASCTSVLDFGCGYATDLMVLAKRYPHLELHGYTISAQQAELDRQRVSEASLGDRVAVYHRDSAKDPFPGLYDVAFGFEVAHHIQDKHSLFGNLSGHLREGGALVLADFISNVGFEIEHEDTSSFFLMKDQWVDVLSQNGLEVVDCVDLSQEVANYLHDPDFDAKLEQQQARPLDQYNRAALKSYDQLGKMLRRGLASYVLLSARKASGRSAGELAAQNRHALERLIPYETSSSRLGRETFEDWFYALQWQRKELTAASLGVSSVSGVWLILSDRGGTGAALAASLRREGETCVEALVGPRYAQTSPSTYEVDPADPDALKALVARVFGDGAHSRGIVHLWSLDTAPASSTTPSSLDADTRRGCLSALAAAQALAQGRWREAPRLWLVTRAAQSTTSSAEEVSLAQAPLWGFARTLAVEHPELGCTRIDLSPAPTSDEVLVLGRELRAADGEVEVALRPEGRYVARLSRSTILSAVDKAPVRADASYLITGGLGGLGLSVARWLVEQGARSLILVGRRDPSEDARARLAELDRAGVSVLVVRADVSRREDVAAVMADLDAHAPPLAGVVHAAGVIQDRTILELDEPQFLRALEPKVFGAWNLHTATEARPLDFFVLYSSAASILGSAGQANYAAGNAFLDALARYRRAQGLPAVSVQWGPFVDVGMAAAQQNRSERLAVRGLGGIAPREGTRVLGRLLERPPIEVGVWKFDVERWCQSHPSIATSPLWTGLRTAQAPPKSSVEVNGAGFMDALRGAQPEERLALLEEHLVLQVSRVSRLDVSLIDRHVPLTKLGVDSLMSLELRNRLDGSLGIKVGMAKLAQQRGIARFAEYLLERLVAEGALAEASPANEEEWELISL